MKNMKKESRNVLGPSINYFRNEKKVTQEQLAARLAIQGIAFDRSVISRIENQSRVLYDYEIIGIAKALRIDIFDLFGQAKKYGDF